MNKFMVLVAMGLLLSGATDAKKGGGKGTGVPCGRGYISSADTCHIGSGSSSSDGSGSSSSDTPPPVYIHVVAPIMRPVDATPNVTYINLFNLLSLPRFTIVNNTYMISKNQIDYIFDPNTQEVRFGKTKIHLSGKPFLYSYADGNFNTNTLFIPLEAISLFGCSVSEVEKGQAVFRCGKDITQTETPTWDQKNTLVMNPSVVTFLDNNPEPLTIAISKSPFPATQSSENNNISCDSIKMYMMNLDFWRITYGGNQYLGIDSDEISCPDFTMSVQTDRYFIDILKITANKFSTIIDLFAPEKNTFFGVGITMRLDFSNLGQIKFAPIIGYPQDPVIPKSLAMAITQAGTRISPLVFNGKLYPSKYDVKLPVDLYFSGGSNSQWQRMTIDASKNSITLYKTSEFPAN